LKNTTVSLCALALVRRTGEGGGGRAGGATIVNKPQDSPDPRLLAPVPPEQRVSRAELVRIADSYFEGIDTATDSSITPFRDDCQRRENGTITSNNPAAAPDSMAILACKQQLYSVPDHRLHTDFARLYEAKGFTPNHGR
jgi:hypothetical protein